MPICQYTEICPFFITDIGYSPEMHRTMKQRFCFEDNSSCVRFAAMEVLAIEDIPDDLLPTDAERLRELVAKKGTKG